MSETLRKEGDAYDPYITVRSFLEAGMFDEVISKFGARIPPKLILNKPTKPN